MLHQLVYSFTGPITWAQGGDAFINAINTNLAGDIVRNGSA